MREKLKKELREGDVILSTNPEHPVSELIRETTNSDYSHTMYVLSNKVCIEATVGGVKRTDLSHYVDSKQNLVLLRRKNTSPSDIKKKSIEICRLVGLRYSYFQLFTDWVRFMFGFLVKEDIDTRAFTCSELVAYGDKRIHNADVKPGIPYYLTSPSDFLNSPFYDIVVESIATELES